MTRAMTRVWRYAPNCQGQKATLAGLPEPASLSRKQYASIPGRYVVRGRASVLQPVHVLPGVETHCSFERDAVSGRPVKFILLASAISLGHIAALESPSVSSKGVAYAPYVSANHDDFFLVDQHLFVVFIYPHLRWRTRF